MKEIEIFEVKKEDLMDDYYTEWGTLDKFFNVPNNEITDVDVMLDCYFDNNCYGEMKKLRLEKSMRIGLKWNTNGKAIYIFHA